MSSRVTLEVFGLDGDVSESISLNDDVRVAQIRAALARRREVPVNQSRFFKLYVEHTSGVLTRLKDADRPANFSTRAFFYADSREENRFSCGDGYYEIVEDFSSSNSNYGSWLARGDLGGFATTSSGAGRWLVLKGDRLFSCPVGSNELSSSVISPSFDEDADEISLRHASASAAKRELTVVDARSVAHVYVFESSEITSTWLTALLKRISDATDRDMLDLGRALMRDAEKAKSSAHRELVKAAASDVHVFAFQTHDGTRILMKCTQTEKERAAVRRLVDSGVCDTEVAQLFERMKQDSAAFNSHLAHAIHHR